MAASGVWTKISTTALETSRKAYKIALAGSGFLADAYDLFVINIVMKLLATHYDQSAGDKALVASTALFGAVIGQVLFGSLADTFGRRAIFILTALLTTVGAVGSSICFEATFMPPIHQQIAFWRFILGVGVGGEYPLSATVASESVSGANRGRAMMLVFSMQGIGSLASSLVVLIMLALGLSHEVTWRCALAAGAIPSASSLAFRAYMRETEDFEAVKARRKNVAATSSVPSDHDPTLGGRIARMSSCIRMRCREALNGIKGYEPHIIGTALSWFVFDVVSSFFLFEHHRGF